MNTLFPEFTDEEIAVKVVQRAALLRKAAEEEGADRERQFQEFAGAYFLRPKVAALLNDPATGAVAAEVRKHLGDSIRKQFLYVPTAESSATQSALRDQAYGILPQTICSERWGPDTCGCRLESIYDSSDIVGTQRTFAVVPCADHSGLTIEEQHECVHGENQRKNGLYSTLLGLRNPELDLKLGEVKDGGTVLKEGLEYRWSFSGKGLDRALQVEIAGLGEGALDKAALQTHCDDEHGPGKVVIV